LSGNATTATTATQVSNSLTLATSGTGLSGSATFNGSSAQTFTVSSNATNLNTGSAIVARDASGNFSAGTITAALSGNASTATSATTAGSITSQANSATITASSTNTANQIVLRDGSGNFSAGTITATLNGSSSSTSGNAATATALSSGQSNWSGTGVLGNVVGMLAWKNYGNSHVIFDASNGTSPSGGSVNSTNSQVAWTAGYPTLMGWNGGNTYGVRVDSARIADSITSQANSATITATTSSTGNTIPLRDASGYIFNSYFNTSGGGSERNASGMSYFAGFNSSDYYIRSYTPAAVATAISGQSMNIAGNATTATSSPLVSALGNYVWSTSTSPTGYNQGIQSSFVSSAQGFPSYGSVMTMNTYSGGGGALQMYVPYSPSYGGTGIQVRFGNYDAGDAWTSFKTLLASDNYTSYAPSLTGSGASGTWSINVTGSAGSATTATTATTANALATGNNYQVNSLGVGTAGSGTAGEIRATNAVTAYYSDDRLKTRFGNITGALAKVKTLDGFYYEANETAQALGYKPKREVGVSAQSVQAVLPEVVVPAPIDEQYLTVHYDKLVPLLIEAIKELEAKVAALEAKG
jgi:hypothetical protein